MNVSEPRRSRWDLCFRLGKTPIRITPLFWTSSAALGVRYYADPEDGHVGYFVFWMAAVLISCLLSGLGQAFMGRRLGMQGEVVLSSLGNVILGVEALGRCWRRVLVLLAGPLVQGLLVAATWGTTFAPFPDFLVEWGWQTPIATCLAILLWINLYWGVLNLLPLWPCVGGRITCEIGGAVFGRRGEVAALLLSLLACILLTFQVIERMSGYLQLRYDPRYAIRLGHSCVLLLFCFVLWLRTFRALWPTEQT